MTTEINGFPLAPGESWQDLGSLDITGQDKDIIEFQGLSVDYDKLPTYKYMGTGSTCLMIDTGDFYIYESTTQQWYEQ